MSKKSWFCGSADHLPRREFLKQSAMFAGAMSSVHAFAHDSLASTLKKQDRRVILLWLAGGASQLETWDPKPGRPTGGPYLDIETSVPGVRISELMPQMAKRLQEHTAIVRSLNTRDGGHGTGAELMMRGRKNEPALEYPDLGAILAKELGRLDSKVPNYIHLYSETEGRNASKPSSAFLGPLYSPIKLYEEMKLPNVIRPESISAADHQAREALRSRLSQRFLDGRNLASVGSHNEAYHRVKGLMASDQLFDISGEPAAIREKYGSTRFGEQALIARRLVEAGVPFVSVARAWWDSHGQNFETHYEMVPELDRVMAALLDDLKERGLLEHTLVITTAEFGRTPRINGSLGRDHFGNAWSSTLSGCGVRGGAVFGRTDENGNTVADGEVGAEEFFATILNAVGINHTHEYHVGQRPVPLVNVGHEPIRDVLA